MFLLRLGHGHTREKGDAEVDKEQAEAVLMAVALLKGELVVNGGEARGPGRRSEPAPESGAFCLAMCAFALPQPASVGIRTLNQFSGTFNLPPVNKTEHRCHVQQCWGHCDPLPLSFSFLL